MCMLTLQLVITVTKHSLTFPAPRIRIPAIKKIALRQHPRLSSVPHNLEFYGRTVVPHLGNACFASLQL
jgi:hypothetical protein